MSKRQVIMILGVWVIFLPFIGLISFWKNILDLITGLLIIGFAYKMLPVNSSSNQEKRSSDAGNLNKTQEVNSDTNLPFVDSKSGLNIDNTR